MADFVTRPSVHASHAICYLCVLPSPSHEPGIGFVYRVNEVLIISSQGQVPRQV